MKYKKRSITAVLIAFIMLTVFTSCEETKKEQDDDKPKEEEPVDPPRQIVPLEQAKATYTNYSNRRVPLIEKSEPPKPDGSKFDPTRYTYYNYETIKQYMAYIDQEAKRANVKISSLRFYFSNYPDSTHFKNGNKVVHPRQNSIFLIPATTKDGLEYPFYLEENEDGQWEAVLLTGQLDPYGEQGMGMHMEDRLKSYAGFGPNSTATLPAATLNNHEKSLILNEGGSAPPPYH